MDDAARGSAASAADAAEPDAPSDASGASSDGASSRIREATQAAAAVGAELSGEDVWALRAGASWRDLGFSTDYADQLRREANVYRLPVANDEESIIDTICAAKLVLTAYETTSANRLRDAIQSIGDVRKRGHIDISTLQATSIGLTLRLVSQKGRTKDVRRAAYVEIQELKKIYEAEAEARRSQAGF